MTGGVESVAVSGTRDMRFCEILVVKATGIDVYNTTGTNECPAELWGALDLEQLKQQFGALQISLNGPKFWMMDSQTLSLGETASFGGLEARWVATLDPELISGTARLGPYEVFTPDKTQRMVYDSGKPVFELVDPDGFIYVLQAHGAGFTIETLPTLGEQMKVLPEGWQYRIRTLTEDLVLDLGHHETIYAISDEFDHYYTRI